MSLKLFAGYLAVASAGVSLIALAVCTRPVVAASNSPAAPAWDRAAAERYLDGREVWWQGWDHAKKDHGTYCISCHTQEPYALAQPILRHDLKEPAETSAEQAMLASIEKRVAMWNEVDPFYPDEKYGDGKKIESRNAESVLNAVILANYDASSNTSQDHLREVTRQAFDIAWSQQSQSGPIAGAWIWQNFHYTPWESPESEYHGAALMAMAVGIAPDRYRDDAKAAHNIDLLRGYLRSHYDAQPLLNKVILLWASAHLPDLLDAGQRAALLADLKSKQQADGGWSLTDLGKWERVDNTPLETRSDGYATGVILLALEENRVKDASVDRGLAWLTANQDKTTGAWPAWSLNKKRNPKSDAGPFMNDAATGYAVLALEARR
jgi:squalene-hopene/tetraprenyl-beta-curcumene cyclase